MKKLLSILLILFLMPSLSAFAAKREPVYTTTGKIHGTVFAEMDRDSAAVGRVGPGYTVKVYELYPEWALVSCIGEMGYTPRKYLEIGKPVDPENTPPWGVEFYQYVGTVGAEGLSIYTEKDRSSEKLISFGEGTRFSIIDIEDGWGRVAYYRQFAYIDTNDLKDLLPVCVDAFSGTDHAPIATFTSYYVVGSEDISVSGKEKNIHINCDYMTTDIMAPGATLDYNDYYGPFSPNKGYVKGPALIETGWGLGYGGGVCQVSSTLYNVLLQLPGIKIVLRRSHGSNGAEYLPLDMDAAVGNESKGINLIFKNMYDFPIRFEAHVQDGALFLAIYRADENAVATVK